MHHKYLHGRPSVQEASGTQVRTQAMPMTAKGMLATMMMAMMMLVFTIIVHFVLGIVVNDAVLPFQASRTRELPQEMAGP